MPKKRIQCDFEGCIRSYCSAFNLKRHIESAHFGIRKFKCPICGRYLSSKQNLIDHQNIHTGAKPYQCRIAGCGIFFRQLSQFYLHQQLHSEVNAHLENNYNNQLQSHYAFLLKAISTDQQYTYDTLLSQGTEKIELPPIVQKDFCIKLPILPQLI